jgi:hypothetical protein
MKENERLFIEKKQGPEFFEVRKGRTEEKSLNEVFI